MIQISNQKLKEILVKEGLIDPKNFDELVQEAERFKQSLVDILLSREIVSLDYFYNLISRYLNIEMIDLTTSSIDEAAMSRLDQAVARQKRVIIFKKEPDGSLDAAMEDPSDLKTIEFLERNLRTRIKAYLAKPADLERGFAIYNRLSVENFKKIIEENIQSSLKISKEDKAEKVANEIPIVAIVDNFIAYAATLRASDIHMESLEDAILLRFRVDGILHEILRIPKDVHAAILARIKLLAALKIDEHYKPQDGRFRYKLGEGILDVRVSILPTFYGEKIEMRLLPASQKPLSLEELGMLEDTRKIVRENLKKTYGMVLITGPTGSGKTTTLYSILNILNRPEVNIVTIEDPIEYSIRYINHTQINPLSGVTFASGLRSILRQDPNIIMVGEIRDEETAEISVHAALTGHLLLSSLHTNDAPTAVPRLVDMKIQPFLVAAVLNAVIAQRLVRKVCLSCIESYEVTPDIAKMIEKEKVSGALSQKFVIPKRFYRGRGCAVCNNSGYLGRLGIYEALNVDNDVRNSIVKPDFSLSNLVKLGREKGVASMFEDGLRKAELGMTTVEEVLRVIRE